MAYEWIVPAVAGAASLIGGYFQNKAARKRAKDEQRFIVAANNRQEEFARRSYEDQNKRDVEFWKMQNAYNDPIAQMQRMQGAGLNPNLVYGSGTSNVAGPIATHSAPQPNLQKHAPVPNDEILAKSLGGSIFDVLNVASTIANIARTEADTKRVEAQTAGTNFENQIKGDSSYISGILRKLELENTGRMESNKAKGYENVLNEGLQGFSMHGDKLGVIHWDDLAPNLRKAAATAHIERTITEARTAASLERKADFEATIKGFEARLADMGIFRGDDGWSRLFNYLMNNVFGGNMQGAGGSAIGSALKMLTPLLKNRK